MVLGPVWIIRFLHQALAFQLKLNILNLCFYIKNYWLYLHKNNDFAIKPMQSKWVFNLEIFPYIWRRELSNYVGKSTEKQPNYTCAIITMLQTSPCNRSGYLIPSFFVQQYKHCIALTSLAQSDFGKVT